MTIAFAFAATRFPWKSNEMSGTYVHTRVRLRYIFSLLSIFIFLFFFFFLFFFIDETVS